MPLAYQRWKAEESQGRIISALEQAPKTFTQLLEATGLSKTVLTHHLKGLLDKKKVRRVPDRKAENFLYTLVQRNLTERDRYYILFSRLRREAIVDLEKAVSDKTVSDEKYMELFNKKLNELTVCQLVLTHLVSPDTGKEWIEQTYGREFSAKLPTILQKRQLHRLIENRIPELAYLAGELKSR